MENLWIGSYKERENQSTEMALSLKVISLMGIYKVRDLYTLRMGMYRNVISIRAGGMAAAHSTQRRIRKNVKRHGRMGANMEALSAKNRIFWIRQGCLLDFES